MFMFYVASKLVTALCNLKEITKIAKNIECYTRIVIKPDCCSHCKKLQLKRKNIFILMNIQSRIIVIIK